MSRIELINQMEDSIFSTKVYAGLEYEITIRKWKIPSVQDIVIDIYPVKDRSLQPTVRILESNEFLLNFNNLCSMNDNECNKLTVFISEAKELIEEIKTRYDELITF